MQVDACAATAYFAKSVARIVSAGETLDNNIVLQLLNLFLCSKATLRFAAVQVGGLTFCSLLCIYLVRKSWKSVSWAGTG